MKQKCAHCGRAHWTDFCYKLGDFERREVKLGQKSKNDKEALTSRGRKQREVVLVGVGGMPQKMEGQKDKESAMEPKDNGIALEDGIVMGVVVEESGNTSGGPSVAVG